MRLWKRTRLCLPDASHASTPCSRRSELTFPYRIPLNASFLLAILAVFSGVGVFVEDEMGLRIARGRSANPDAAEYAGISVKKQIVLAMALSGAIAGLVGVNEVLYYRYRYYHDFGVKYGFTGIAVALARSQSSVRRNCL